MNFTNCINCIHKVSTPNKVNNIGKVIEIKTLIFKTKKCLYYMIVSINKVIKVFDAFNVNKYKPITFQSLLNIFIKFIK